MSATANMSPSSPPGMPSSATAIELPAARLPREGVALLIDQQEWHFTVRGDQRLDTGLGRYWLNPDLPHLDWLNFAAPHSRRPDHLSAFLQEAGRVFSEHRSLRRIVLDAPPGVEAEALIAAHRLRHERCLTRLLLTHLLPLLPPPEVQVEIAPGERLREFVELSLRAFRGEAFRWGHSADQLLEYCHRRRERGERFLLASLQDATVGAATLMPGLVPQITTVAVRFAARRRGVATALLHQAVHLALEEGAWGVWLATERASLAEGIYRRRGFEPLCERHEYIGS